jgi:hypothetical protein
MTLVDLISIEWTSFLLSADNTNNNSTYCTYPSIRQLTDTGLSSISACPSLRCQKSRSCFKPLTPISNILLHSTIDHNSTFLPKTSAVDSDTASGYPLLQKKYYYPMATTTSKDLPGELSYVQYQHALEAQYLPAIRALISKDLSEPYSIYVYRYFLCQWGHLCFMVRIHSVPQVKPHILTIKL